MTDADPRDADLAFPTRIYWWVIVAHLVCVAVLWLFTAWFHVPEVAGS